MKPRDHKFNAEVAATPVSTAPAGEPTAEELFVKWTQETNFKIVPEAERRRGWPLHFAEFCMAAVASRGMEGQERLDALAKHLGDEIIRGDRNFDWAEKYLARAETAERQLKEAEAERDRIDQFRLAAEGEVDGLAKQFKEAEEKLAERDETIRQLRHAAALENLG